MSHSYASQVHFPGYKNVYKSVFVCDILEIIWNNFVSVTYTP